MKSKLSFFLFFSFFCVLACSDTNEFKQGQSLYLNYCSSCHLERGQGLRGLYPPLAKSDYLAEHQDELACLIRYGIEEVIQVNGKTYDVKMEGIKGLSDFEITNVINFINHSWGNDLDYVKFVDIKAQLQACEE